jgi:hypothetical protein
MIKKFFLLLALSLTAYYEIDLNKALSEKICEGCDLTKTELANGNLTLDNPNLTFLKSLNVTYGTDLKNARFAYSNLNGSNLKGMDLSNSDLRYTSLSGLYLNNANLENADLRYTKSGGTEYIGANLHNAHLEGADLSGSLLVGAKKIETVHCDSMTKLPFGYTCVNKLINVGNCQEPTKIPLGYYCNTGNKKPQQLPFKEEDLAEVNSPQEFYNFFKTLKQTFQK